MSDKTQPTHWMDDRGFSVTDDWLKNDPHSTSDYRAAYNIPCVKKRGKIVPIESPDPQPVPHAIERDESMDRTYIPMPGGWEVQTQGKGSSFRLCNTKTGQRWIITDKMAHKALEQMARDANAAVVPHAQVASDELLDPEMPAAVMRLHMGEMTPQEMRTARAAIRWANTRLLVLAALAAPASGPDQAGGRT